jgi:hypothetical protein
VALNALREVFLATRVEYDGGRDFPRRSRPKVYSSLLPKARTRPLIATEGGQSTAIGPEGFESLFGNDLSGVTPLLHYVVSGR